jgi:cytochrome c556
LCTIGILLAAGLLAIAEPKSSPQPRPYKPVQSIEQMMEGQKRLFDDIKEAIGAKEWDEAATSAWILAEVANANRYQREDPAYQDFAEQVSTQCKQLAQLATKRDDASSRAAVNTIGKTCNACHEQFQKKKP